MYFFYLLIYKCICCMYSFELSQPIEAIQMSTNNICLYKENQEKKIWALTLLNNTLMKFSVDLTLKCVLIRWIFYYKFFMQY